MKKISLVFALLAMCAIAQAGFTDFNCTFDNDPLVENHVWTFTEDTLENTGGFLSLVENYTVTYPGTDAVNMFATTDTDPIFRATKYVTNSNSHAWTSYTLTLNGPASVSFVGTPSSDFFHSAVINGNVITYSDGIVDVGDEVQLNFRVQVADIGDFSWCVTQQAIPEPITVALLGLGGLLIRRKK